MCHIHKRVFFLNCCLSVGSGSSVNPGFPKLILFLPLGNERANALCKGSVDCKPSEHSGQIWAVGMRRRDHWALRGDRQTLTVWHLNPFREELRRIHWSWNRVAKGLENLEIASTNQILSVSGCPQGLITLGELFPIQAKSPRNINWSLWLPPIRG